MVNDVLREVVVATSADLAKLTNHLAEGVYLVGTGSSGVSGEKFRPPQPRIQCLEVLIDA